MSRGINREDMTYTSLALPTENNLGSGYAELVPSLQAASISPP